MLRRRLSSLFTDHNGAIAVGGEEGPGEGRVVDPFPDTHGQDFGLDPKSDALRLDAAGMGPPPRQRSSFMEALSIVVPVMRGSSLAFDSFAASDEPVQQGTGFFEPSPLLLGQAQRLSRRRMSEASLQTPSEKEPPAPYLSNDRHGRPLESADGERWRNKSRAARSMAEVAEPSMIALEVARRETLCCLVTCQYMVILLAAFSLAMLFTSASHGHITLEPCNGNITANVTDARDPTLEWLNDWKACGSMNFFPVQSGVALGSTSSTVNGVSARACYTEPTPEYDSVVILETCTLSTRNSAISAVGIGLRVTNGSFPRLAEDDDVGYALIALGCVSSICNDSMALLVEAQGGLSGSVEAVLPDSAYPDAEAYSLNVLVYSNPYNALRHAKYVVILDADSGLLQAPVDAAQIDIAYRTQPGLFIARWACMVLLLLVAVRWLRGLWRVSRLAHRRWLVEWTWLSFMLAGGFLGANPIIMGMTLQIGDNDWAGYDKDLFAWLCISDTFTTVGTLVLWLGYWMLSDRPRLYGISKRRFYLPKVAVFMVLFLIRFAVVLLGYPIVWHEYSEQLTAPQAWSHERQAAYTVLSVVDRILTLFLVLRILHCLYRSRRILQRMPYLKARRTALAFRLFAWLSVVGWVVLCLVVASSLAASRKFYARGGAGSTRLEQITSSQYAQRVAISTDVTIVVYNTTCLIILLFMYSPVRWLSIAQSDRRICIRWEEQMPSIPAVRTKAYGKLPEEQLRASSYHFDSSRVFCVETARWLLNMAQQAYRDWPGEPRSDALPPLDVEQFGFDLVARFRDEETDTRAIVARHRSTRRLVVAFRGTKSKAHFKTDLEYKLAQLDTALLTHWGKTDNGGSVDAPEYLRVPLRPGGTQQQRSATVNSRRKSVTASPVAAAAAAAIAGGSNGETAATAPAAAAAAAGGSNGHAATSAGRSSGVASVAAAPPGGASTVAAASEPWEGTYKVKGGAWAEAGNLTRFSPPAFPSMAPAEEEKSPFNPDGSNGDTDATGGSAASSGGSSDGSACRGGVSRGVGESSTPVARESALADDSRDHGGNSASPSTPLMRRTQNSSSRGRSAGSPSGGNASDSPSEAEAPHALPLQEAGAASSGGWIRAPKHFLSRFSRRAGQSGGEEPSEASSLQGTGGFSDGPVSYPLQGDWRPASALPWEISDHDPLAHVPGKVRRCLTAESPQSRKSKKHIYGQALMAVGRYQSCDPVAAINHMNRDYERIPERVGVHTGFFRAYNTLRERIHAVMVDELTREPAAVFFTGHSLGGALSTLASYDCALHLLPRLQATMRERTRVARANARRNSSGPGLGSGGLSSGNESTCSWESDLQFSEISLGVYTFGSPKVGNIDFARVFDMLVPHCWRVVVDGDVIAAVPPTGAYQHVGVAAITDRFGAGHLILNPGASEYQYRTSRSISIECHMFPTYIRGLEGLLRPLDEDHEKHLIARPWSELPRDPDSVASLSLKPPEPPKERFRVVRATLRKLGGKLHTAPQGEEHAGDPAGPVPLVVGESSSPAAAVFSPLAAAFGGHLPAGAASGAQISNSFSASVASAASATAAAAMWQARIAEDDEESAVAGDSYEWTRGAPEARMSDKPADELSSPEPVQMAPSTVRKLFRRRDGGVT